MSPVALFLLQAVYFATMRNWENRDNMSKHILRFFNNRTRFFDCFF